MNMGFIKATSLFLIVLFLFHQGSAFQIDDYSEDIASSHILSISDEIVAVSDSDPFYSLLGSYTACYYTNDESVLKPYFIVHNNSFSIQQNRVLRNLSENDPHILSIGDFVISEYQTTSFIGSPDQVSLDLATHRFDQVESALIISIDGDEAYKLGLQAAPLASYLNIPILIYNDSWTEIQDILDALQVSEIYLVGRFPFSQRDGYDCILLDSSVKIQDKVVSVIKNRFGSLNYITLTNPADVEDAISTDTLMDTLNMISQVNN